MTVSTIFGKVRPAVAASVEAFKKRRRENGVFIDAEFTTSLATSATFKLLNCAEISE
jgi:hypothetical protein